MEERIRIMLSLLDERQRRIFLASEAKTTERSWTIYPIKETTALAERN